MNKSNVQVAEAQEKHRLPLLIGRSTPSSRSTDVQAGAIGLNDLLNIELRDGNLKMSDQAWDETLTAMDMKLEMASWKVQLDKSTIMKNALALNRSDPVRQQEPKSCTKLKALVTSATGTSCV